MSEGRSDFFITFSAYIHTQSLWTKLKIEILHQFFGNIEKKIWRFKKRKSASQGKNLHFQENSPVLIWIWNEAIFLVFWFLYFLCKFAFFKTWCQNEEVTFSSLFQHPPTPNHYEQNWKWGFCINFLEISLFYHNIHN